MIESHERRIGSMRMGRQAAFARCWQRAVFTVVATLVSGYSAMAQDASSYIVSFRPGTSLAARADIVRARGAALRVNFRGVTAAAVTVPNANALAALQRDPSVLAVIPDRPVRAIEASGVRPDAGRGGSGGGTTGQVVPAGVTRVGAPTTSSNGSGVGVAIVDTGVDLPHRDLSGTIDAFNAFTGGSCQDDQGHGTHVAGTVAARDNGVDVVGVAPGAQIYCVKVLDSAGNGSDSTVMAGLDWVLDHAADVRVVNMSLGRVGAVGDNTPLHDLVKALVAARVVVVVAAGNDPSLEVTQQIPAAYPEVIAVASTTAVTGSNQCRFLSSPIVTDTASFFTTDGVGVAISAPGEEKKDVSKGCMIQSTGILSTRLGGGTTRMSGTSMASPHVAGIAVRYLQQNSGYTPGDIKAMLQAAAASAGQAPRDSPSSAYTFDGVREGIAQAP